MKIELIQIDGRDGDTAYNLQRTLEAIASCKADTDLLVFPETQLMGFASAEQLPLVAEPLHGPALQAVQQAVCERDVAVVIGIAEQADGVYYNTSMLLTPKASPCLIARLTCGRPSVDCSSPVTVTPAHAGKACASVC